MRYPAILAVGAVLVICMHAMPAQAGKQRNRADETPAVPGHMFQPAAAAPLPLSALVLSGLDYTAIAPPGMRLRIIEDEPYVRVSGQPGLADAQWQRGLSVIVLRGNTADSDWYEARVSLRVAPGNEPDNPLVQSFDTAAHYAYNGNLVFPEDRGAIAYSLSEVRSPLGLTDPDDALYSWREYLAYTAAVLNTIGWDHTAPELLPATPYQFVKGELRVLRVVGDDLYLLSLEFEASEYPYSLGLSENIARCVLNRLQSGLKQQHALTYLAYHPEYEPTLPYFEGEQLDPRTADLTEQPGEGCGLEPLPITGDVCPECAGDGPHWPAAPYQDAMNSYKLPGMDEWPRCSHCLLEPFGAQDWEKFKQPPGAHQPKTPHGGDCPTGKPPTAPACDNCGGKQCGQDLCSSRKSCSARAPAALISSAVTPSLSPWADPLQFAGQSAETAWDQGSGQKPLAVLLSQVQRSF